MSKKLIKIKSILSLILIVSGCVFVCYASFLFIYNQQIENNAQTYCQDVLVEINKNFKEDIKTEVLKAPVSTPKFNEKDEKQLLVDGDLYIGVLKIPIINLELPIQNEWSYDKLTNTPCVFKTEPFSIAGHNYIAHFGKLSNLHIGDEAIFLDANGLEYLYKVTSISKIHETDIEALQDDTFDLTLFTCNINNDNERILVRLNYTP